MVLAGIIALNNKGVRVNKDMNSLDILRYAEER